MTVAEFLRRFPEVPASLADEALLARYVDRLGPWLAEAVKPSPCQQRHERAHVLYLKLVGPLAVYGYGLMPLERLREQLGDILDVHAADPSAFPESLIPDLPPPGTGGAASCGPGAS